MIHIGAYVGSYPYRQRIEQEYADFSRSYRCEINSSIAEGNQQVVVLSGISVPVNFRGVPSYIPISIQLPFHYPNVAPLVQVKATDSMPLNMACSYLTPHTNGQVRLDYLSYWRPTSTLLGLVSELQRAFSADIPIYSASSVSTTHSPYPTGATMMMPTPNVPYSYSATPVSIPSVYSAPTPGSNYPPSNLPYPPYPSHPAYPPAPTTSYPYGTSCGYPPNVPSPTNPYANSSCSMAGYPTPYQSTNYYQQAATPSDPLLAGLLAKASQKITDKRTTLRAELQTQTSTYSSIQSGAVTLGTMLQRLADEESRASATLQTVKQANEQLLKTVELQESMGNIAAQPDDIIQVTQPLYKQLADAYAEDQAIEDAIYYLSNALHEGAIDFESFQREVRSLARRQFVARHTTIKCRQKAGLPPL